MEASATVRRVRSGSSRFRMRNCESGTRGNAVLSFSRSRPASSTGWPWLSNDWTTKAAVWPAAPQTRTGWREDELRIDDSDKKIQTCTFHIGQYIQVCIVSTKICDNDPMSQAKPRKDMEPPPGDVQQRILDTAAHLFYSEGVRAIGIDLIIDRAQVAKTSLYRYFRTKDDLVAAFLEREDREFWQQ